MSSTPSTAVEATTEAVNTVKCSGQERGVEEDSGNSQAATSSAVAAVQQGMAADIAELRAIVMAAAKHFKIEMDGHDGEPILPQASVDLESIKPTDEGYDQETTLRRQIAVRPTEATLKSISDWNKWPRALRNPEFETAKLALKPHQFPRSTKGLQPIMEWALYGPLSTDVAEFGYTADGYPCQLGTQWDQDKPHLATLELFHEHTVITESRRQHLRRSRSKLN